MNHPYRHYTVPQLEQLLDKERRNLFTLRLQAADYGSSAIPLHLANEIQNKEQIIQDIEAGIAQHKQSKSESVSTATNQSTQNDDIGLNERQRQLFLQLVDIDQSATEPGEFITLDVQQLSEVIISYNGKPKKRTQGYMVDLKILSDFGLIKLDFGKSPSFYITNKGKNHAASLQNPPVDQSPSSNQSGVDGIPTYFYVTCDMISGPSGPHWKGEVITLPGSSPSNNQRLINQGAMRVATKEEIAAATGEPDSHLHWTKSQQRDILLEYRRTREARCPDDQSLLDIINVGTYGNRHEVDVECPSCKKSFTGR